MHIVERYHDFSCGHRVVGHEGACALMHGHNYRITFGVAAKETQTLHSTTLMEGAHTPGKNPMLDNVGRVVDFSVLKDKLCQWLEDNWDHRFLAWTQDYDMRSLNDDQPQGSPADILLGASLVWVPFNPTAENMAQYLVEVIGPQQLAGTGVELIGCKVEETRKCTALYGKEGY